MSNTVSIAIRLDKELKNSVVSILDGLGLDLTTAIRMYLSQVVIQEAVPFNVSYSANNPNESTIEALNWAREYKKTNKKTGFKTTEDFYKHLGI